MKKSTSHLQGEMDHTFEYDRGLKLVYRCYGDPDGSPAFYFHGWPGSRLEGELFNDLAKKNQCLLIAPERPGYGHSTSSQHLPLKQWADLIKGLANHLELERFSVIGLSGGGPHACATMSCLPERILTGCLIVPMGPLHAKMGVKRMNPAQRLMAESTPLFPMLTQMALRTLCPFAGYAPGLVISIMRHLLLPACDQRALDTTGLQAVLVRNMAEALSGGAQGMYEDGLRFLEPWHKTLNAIQCPVKIWHGYDDNIVPIEFGKYLAKMIPNAESSWLPDEGHFSVPVSCAHECFEFLNRK